jgi:predicted O-methyltransferase YrrM
VPFVEEFLAQRTNPMDTHTDHRAVSLRFRLTGNASPEEFVLRLADRRAYVDTDASAAPVDSVVECPVEDFRDVVEGRRELFGPFWNENMPADLTPAAGLAAFLFPGHPYRGLNPVIDEIYTTASNYPTITPFTQAYKLHSLVVEEKLALTFEIGLAFAASGLLIADAHERKGSGHHFAADPFQTGNFFRGKGLENVERSGLGPYLTWIDQRARPTLSGLRRAGVSFDMIYIDGDHSVPAVLSDFSQSDAVLKVGGYLAFDDSHMPSGVKVLDIVRNHFDYEEITEVSTDRFTLLRKRSHRSGSIPVQAAALTARMSADSLEWGRNKVRMALRRQHH